MKRSDKVIVGFAFDVVMVPTHPGSISSPGHEKPLHMLPSGGKSGWTMQFDELDKLIVRLQLADGAIGLGEFYRDANLNRVRDIANGLLGQSLVDLPLQKLPIPLSRI